MKTILSLFACLALLLSGCKSPETTAYKTIATTAQLVDKSMLAWGDYVRAGKATADDEKRVKAAFEIYKRAETAAQRTVYTIKTAPNGQQDWVTAVSVLTANSSELFSIVHQLTTK